jgi:hypothetical protein
MCIDGQGLLLSQRLPDAVVASDRTSSTSSADDGRFDIWTIGVDGSGLRRITRGPGNKSQP